MLGRLTGKRPSGTTVPAVPVLDPPKKSGVSTRSGSIHSSVSGGSTSTASHSTSKKVVYKLVIIKKNPGGVDQNPSITSSPSSSSLYSEVSIKESEVGVDEGPMKKEWITGMRKRWRWMSM